MAESPASAWGRSMVEARGRAHAEGIFRRTICPKAAFSLNSHIYSKLAAGRGIWADSSSTHLLPQ